jgi:NADH pyrophosphatase NudC (nudix superfamily)
MARWQEATVLEHTCFKCCPRCGKEALTAHQTHGVLCEACGFIYFHNTAAAVMAILETPEGIVFTRRAHDPGRGLLDLPGGFVDHGESLEEALARELREELGITVTNPRYFGSFPNIYVYKGVTYFTADAVFRYHWADPSTLSHNAEISEIAVHKAEELAPESLAFDSVRAVLKKYRLKN